MLDRKNMVDMKSRFLASLRQATVLAAILSPLDNLLFKGTRKVAHGFRLTLAVTSLCAKLEQSQEVSKIDETFRFRAFFCRECLPLILAVEQIR